VKKKRHSRRFYSSRSHVEENIERREASGIIRDVANRRVVSVTRCTKSAGSGFEIVMVRFVCGTFAIHRLISEFINDAHRIQSEAEFLIEI